MAPGGPWYLSFALGFLENLFFFFKEMLGTLVFQFSESPALKIVIMVCGEEVPTNDQ